LYEAKELAVKDPEYQGVLYLAERLSASLRLKMEFFTKLQHFADQINELEKEQNSMDSLSLAEVSHEP